VKSGWIHEMVNAGKVIKWESEMEETTETKPEETAKPAPKREKTKEPEKRRNVYALINQVKLALDAGGGIQ
jgi:hypothetical protein